MSDKSLRRRDIKRMLQSDKSILLSKMSARIKEIDKKLEYLGNKEKFNKLDEKEKDNYSALCGEYLGIRTLMLEITGPIRQTRELAKGKEDALKNIHERKEFEAREREHLNNLPPIDREKLARMQETWDAYIEYKGRAKRLKEEVVY